ncbi:MAG: hemolysin XhlA family protein [Aphanothece sp. CMT-3BRIN-NPC111]|jgi:predicted  nucleic acid-binding Zn-ribbon protein|nr:hemolysin XhlA family protein [Aphanothece sp. CMT-3BRIN-NPC111]
MSLIIESDLKEVLAKIDQKLDKLDAKFDNLGKDVTDLKVGQARLEEKVDGLSKRLDNQEFLSRGVLIGLIVAILGGFAKLFGFVGVQ